MDPITLDRNLAEKLDLGMRSGGTVELPFPVIYAWTMNGQASYKAQGGALYYGGWATKAEDMDALAETANVNIPAGWSRVAIGARDGSEFEAYVNRSVIAAPIGKRSSWILDGRRVPEYVEGGRRHLQVLCYLFEKQGENGKSKLVPWGPAVLTAKGYQARNVLDAFARWNKATAQIRRKAAPGVPAWCFLFALGTFGKERQVVNVGQPGGQSPITPVVAYIPEKLDEAVIASLFVGQEIASEMAGLQDQAAEWLSAWQQPTVEQPAGAGEPQYPDNPPPDEEIPF